MTWSLSASGHTPTPDGAENWSEVEQELHDRLAEVLSDPRYGTSMSTFHGNHVSGQPHVRPEAPADEPEPDAAAEA